MWFTFSLLSGLFYSVQGLITRKVLKGNKDSWAFSFYFSLIGAVVSLPFFISRFKVSENPMMWGLLFIAGALIVTQNFFQFKSLNYLSASVNGSINKFRLVWIFLLGVFILNESWSVQKITGTLLTIVAGLLILKKLNTKLNAVGIFYAFISTVFYGIVILLYKFLFRDFNAQSLTFFIFLFPAIINLLIMPNSLARVKRIVLNDGWGILLACCFGAFANLAMNYALSVGEASRVNVLIESFLVATFVGENIFLKERDNLLVKLGAVILAVAGAVLLKLG